MTVIDTARLTLRRMSADDAPFMLALMNDASFIRHIGDRGVRSLTDAESYIRRGPVASYERHGFGHYLVELKASGAAVGICGLLKRDALADPDIGFAFLPEFRLHGYATESATAVRDYARQVIGLPRLVAITSPGNEGSIRVLDRIGFRFEKMVRLDADAADVKLFAIEFASTEQRGAKHE